MNNLNMNKQLGTKWFTFFTKVRPWLSCIMTFSTIGEFAEYMEIYLNNWWLMLFLTVAIVLPVLNIMVFIKSKGDYVDFVSFVHGVLLFETIGSSYQYGVKQYIQSGYENGAAVRGALIMLLFYFIWYWLNMKYFRKRIIGSNNLKNAHSDEQINIFCSKCGCKLVNDSNFCNQCGTKVLEQNSANIPDKQEFRVITFDTSVGKMRTETRRVDVEKFPPEKFSDNNTYYAVETTKEGKKIRIYYTKDNWEKQIEINKTVEARFVE